MQSRAKNLTNEKNSSNSISQNRRQSRRSFFQRTLGGSVLLASGILKIYSKSAYANERSFDVVVIGSGAAGMTAALRAAKRGLRVLVVEKAAKFGGSTARSGGGIWIRNNVINQSVGIEDSEEEAADYLAAVVGDGVPVAKQQAFIKKGPPMISFLMEHSPLRFRWMEGYPDYYPELPGGKAQGASIEPEVLNGKLLGKELKNLNPPYIPTPPGVTIFGGDYKWLCLAKVTLTGAKTAAQAVARYIENKLKGRIPLTMGQALAAGLRAGLLQAKVPVWLNTSLVDLSMDAQGRVDGVLVSKDGVQTLLRAKQGVVMAAGGFERNLAMRLQYQQKPIGTDWTLGAQENTGDGIRSGQRVGAAIDLMDDAWWGPTIPLTKEEPYFCLSERSLPGSILVNADGQRFVNESTTYHDVVYAMYDQPRVGNELPIWLITDQNYRDSYLFRDVLPGLPLPKEWYASGAVFKASSLKALAEKINLPTEALATSVSRFNEYAKIGRDMEFGRGDSAYDRYYADPNFKPNPSLAMLRKGPFYAFRVVAGDLGTKGGLVTDERARVLGRNGQVIAGLYAAGNVSRSVMGRSYAGAGSTLGPAMTFGFIAADDIADKAGLT